jgi:transposase
MTLTHRRIGCDISKARLDLFDTETDRHRSIPNTTGDIKAWFATLAKGTTIIFEATSPYDTELRKQVDAAGLIAMRVNPTNARNYARAAGYLAKTDRIDARMFVRLPDALALTPEPPYDADREALAALHRRRDQLVEMRAMERTRSADEPNARVQESLARHRLWLDAEVAALDAEIEAALAKPSFKAVVDVVRTVKGVGPVTIATLIALLPELGQRSPKTIAALAGLAPLNRDSGAMRGQRHIGGGRARVRRALYMAAINVIRTNPHFKAIYLAIKERSGKAKIAIVAVARKLLVTLNAMVKKGEPFRA